LVAAICKNLENEEKIMQAIVISTVHQKKNKNKKYLLVSGSFLFQNPSIIFLKAKSIASSLASQNQWRNPRKKYAKIDAIIISIECPLSF